MFFTILMKILYIESKLKNLDEFNLSKEDPTNIYSKIATYESEDED